VVSEMRSLRWQPGRILLAIARGRIAGWIVRAAFSTFSASLPLNRLHETATLVAFHHPSPAYPIHILIVPKRRYESLLDIASDDTEFMRDLFETVASLVREFGLERDSYRLVANGGNAQEVKMLHFHLIAE
jgi:histidine triad (HIT) family protein